MEKVIEAAFSQDPAFMIGGGFLVLFALSMLYILLRYGPKLAQGWIAFVEVMQELKDTLKAVSASLEMRISGVETTCNQNSEATVERYKEIKRDTAEILAILNRLDGKIESRKDV